MDAGSAAATTRRRFGGRVSAAVLTTAMVVSLAVAPAAFAKGSSGGTPWIALASVGGAAPTHPMLGNMVAFAAGYPSATKNPWISLSCYQNSNLVYGEGGGPSHQFQLGGGSSVWLSVGGSANCTAELGDLYWKGGHEYYTYLATTSFGAN